MNAAGGPAWDSAEFTPPRYGQRADERAGNRDRLRELRREVTPSKQGRECGLPIGRSDVMAKQTTDGTDVYYSGLATCGSVWACAPCQAKIRAERADEIARGLANLIEQGGAGIAVALTLPHHVGDRLARTIGLVSAGFQAVASGRPYRRERDRLGIIGHIRAFEVTHGANGWHPHIHLVVALDRPVTPVQVAELRAAWQTRWDAWLIRQGWRKSSEIHGVDMRVVRTTADVAAYLAKLQEGKALDAYRTERSTAAELARGDIKSARAASSRTPLEILADFGTTGNADDLALWLEFEQATKGRSAIRWSPGLRARLLPDEEERTDEEIAAAERDGTDLARIDCDLFRQLARIPGAAHAARMALKRGGFRELLVFVTLLGLDASGLSRPTPADTAGRPPIDGG